MRLLLALLLSLFIGASAHADTPTSTNSPSPTITPTSTITPSPTPGAIVAFYAGDVGCQLCNTIGSTALVLTTSNGAVPPTTSPAAPIGSQNLGTNFAALNSYFVAPAAVITQNGSIALYYYAYAQVLQPSVETVLEVRGVSVGNNLTLVYNYSQKNMRIYYNGKPGGAAVYIDSPLLNTSTWNIVQINHNENGVGISINGSLYATNSTVWQTGTVSQVNIGGSASYFPMTSTNIIDSVLFSNEINEGYPPTLATPTNTPTITKTSTPTATNTFTFSPTTTPTPTISNTFTISPTFSATLTISQTITPTNTPTATPTISQTATPTATPSSTPTATPTQIPSYSSLSLVQESAILNFPGTGTQYKTHFSRNIVQVINVYFRDTTVAGYPNIGSDLTVAGPVDSVDAFTYSTPHQVVSWDTNKNMIFSSSGGSVMNSSHTYIVTLQYLTDNR